MAAKLKKQGGGVRRPVAFNTERSKGFGGGKNAECHAHWGITSLKPGMVNHDAFVEDRKHASSAATAR
jgi:hypothetical protein